ncbi:phosphoribosylformylglycinamidine synthase subunit PurL [uncultured Methanosphaera sp.]|uniref:phosphoribosylformylglycinamidine synthase subunit PurL n=1 Tax=uncultured Methanosphaera sp. TaxID=262501 RepID=UPI000DC246DC|nr:phosphoribosylformylglycinamidine synthase subunit PurL [uncultured Methanosphaera sp.]RAP43862.1 MAG: phosphoribosylformylglycinamidine synthase II [Methanosphaera sp. SHI1033]
MVLTDDELKYIDEVLGRKPNELELGMMDVMFSEHCSYKSSKPILRNFPTEGPDVILGPGDDAGIVSLTDDYALAIGMESHNHPSAVEPYGGAGTGIGGIVRDIISMGARPVVLLDALRFGHMSDQRSKYIFDYVVKGISDYGNRIGVPTVGGEIEFDDNFQYNPMVNVVCAGLVKKDEIVYGSAPVVGDVFLLMGGTTGRDGIHGVTFASEELTSKSEIEDRPAVQVADPFTKKRVMEATYELLDTLDIHGVKDLGGGGLTCCLSEMADKGGNGSLIDLNKIPLREENMTPYEIMLSESQERMVFAISPDDVEKAFEICEKHDLSHAVIGTIIDKREFIIKDGDEEICHAPNILFTEAPIIEREAKEPEKVIEDVTLKDVNPQEALLSLIASENITSKEWVYSQYDHEVQLRTIVKPGDDAAVIKVDSDTSFTIGTDCNSTHVLLNPYDGAAAAVLESINNSISMGGRPLALVDCLNFGNPEKSEVFWQFKEAVRGMSDVANKFEVPFISGNVSFYNETEGVTVNPSPIVGTVGKLNNNYIKTMTFKNKGDLVLIIGNTYSELDGSQYYKTVQDIVQGYPPKIRIDENYETSMMIKDLIKEYNDDITAVHDISKGGLLVALSLMSIKSGMGVNIDLKDIPCGEELSLTDKLFSETNGRFIVTVKEDKLDDMKLLLEGNVPFAVIGTVSDDGFVVKDNDEIININVDELVKANTTTIETHMA